MISLTSNMLLREKIFTIKNSLRYYKSNSSLSVIMIS